MQAEDQLAAFVSGITVTSSFTAQGSFATWTLTTTIPNDAGIIGKKLRLVLAANNAFAVHVDSIKVWLRSDAPAHESSPFHAKPLP